MFAQLSITEIGFDSDVQKRKDYQNLLIIIVAFSENDEDNYGDDEEKT